MGGESTSNHGRERAIEALIDLDPRGPSFRVGRIMVRFRDKSSFDVNMI